MTLCVNIAPDVEEAIRETAQHQGQTPEEVAALVLQSVFVPRPLIVEDKHKAFVESSFAAAAESTRHVWDTPEEDAAWAHLQNIGPADRP